MRARVSEKREVAKGTLLVEFDLLGEEVDFTPGQYFFVNLIDPPYDDERGARRHFSVVTSRLAEQNKILAQESASLDQRLNAEESQDETPVAPKQRHERS